MRSAQIGCLTTRLPLPLPLSQWQDVSARSSRFGIRSAAPTPPTTKTRVSKSTGIIKGTNSSAYDEYERVSSFMCLYANE